jgi:hypothetical protein
MRPGAETGDLAVVSILPPKAPPMVVTRARILSVSIPTYGNSDGNDVGYLKRTVDSHAPFFGYRYCPKRLEIEMFLVACPELVLKDPGTLDECFFDIAALETDGGYYIVRTEDRGYPPFLGVFDGYDRSSGS